MTRQHLANNTGPSPGPDLPILAKIEQTRIFLVAWVIAVYVISLKAHTRVFILIVSAVFRALNYLFFFTIENYYL